MIKTLIVKGRDLASSVKKCDGQVNGYTHPCMDRTRYIRMSITIVTILIIVVDFGG